MTVYSRLTVLGLTLRIRVEGAGPVVVIIPGLTARIEDYDELVAGLRHRFRCVVIDFPGCGQSDKPVRAYTVAYYVQVLFAVLDALHIKTAHLVGGSLGGNVALRAAIAAPERIGRIVAWGVGGAWESKPLLAWLIRQVSRGSGARWLFWATVRLQARHWFGPGVKDKRARLRETFAYFREIFCDGFTRMYWDLAVDQIRNSLFLDAHRVTHPTLLLRGEHDRALGMARGMATLKGHIRNSRLKIIHGAGHALATERPVELAWETSNFLGETDVR